jgi:tetratricopeptide (TPR) repeat protein
MTLHAMANVARGQGRFAEAERTYLQAMQIDPGYADVREDYTEMLASAGYFAEAEASARTLVALDPLVAVFWWRLEHVGLVSLRVELVDEGAARVREISPTSFYEGQAARYLFELSQGNIAAARIALDAASRTAPELMAGSRLLFDWAVHDPAADDAAARRLIKAHVNRATYAALRPDANLFFDTYENDPSRHVRYAFFNTLSEPVAYPLFKDPRAKDALRRYGFVEYWHEKGWPSLCHPLGSDDFECGPPAGSNAAAAKP